MIVAAKQGLGVSAGGGVETPFAMNATGNTGSNFTCEFTSFDQTTSHTISFWFSPNANTIHGAIVNYTGYDVSNHGTGVSLGYGSGTNNMESNGSYCVVLYNTIAWKGGYNVRSYTGWHHYAFVFNAGTTSGETTAFSVDQYFDGVKVKTYSSSNMFHFRSKLYILGLIDGGSNRQVNGKSTCISIRQYAMTSSQVAAEYANGMTKPDLTSVAHYWDGNLTSDGKVKDYVGDWNLTINGDASVVALQ